MANAMDTTLEGNRADLAMLASLSQLESFGKTTSRYGYAFNKLFPIIVQRDKAGTTAFAPAGLTSAAGTRGRANGTALVAVNTTPVAIDWTCARVEGRSSIYFSDVKGFGGIENADKFGGTDSARRAWNSQEVAAFGTVFTSTRTTGAATLTDHSVVKILQQKALAVRAYGSPYLVCTTNAWLALCDIPEIRVRLEKFAGAANDIGFMTLESEKIRTALSSLIGFGGAVLFDSAIVGTASDTYVGVVGLRDANFTAAPEQVLMNAKGAATYGVTNVYLPDDASQDAPFSIRAWNDSDGKRCVYDAEAWLVSTEINASAVAVTKFASAYTEYGATA